MRKATNLEHENKPAAVGSYDSSRVNVDMVIVHTMVGTLEGTAAWFANPNRDKLNSAHYGIGFNGRIQLYVEEDKTAYHAGNYPVNQRSIGIEFEDKGKPTEERPDTLYQTGSKLIADICAHYNIPIDRQHIVKHNEVSQSGTSCPGTLDIDRLIVGAKNLNENSEPVKNYQMTESVFVGLVTKSTNFDTVSEYLELSQEARLDPRAGEVIVNEIKNIQTQSKELIDKSNALLAQIEAKTEAPEENPSVLEKILPQTDTEKAGSIDNLLLFDTKEELDTIERGKSLLFDDISKVFNLLFSWLWT